MFCLLALCWVALFVQLLEDLQALLWLQITGEPVPELVLLLVENISFFLTYLIGLVMLIVVMEVIESSVACLFVCFAMDREALRRNNPMLFQKFMETYGLV
jgi:hypothetical protein